MKLANETYAAAGRPFIKLGVEIASSIMQTLKAGWDLARESPDLHAGKSEVELTEQLRDAMRSVLNSGRFPWGNTMTVLTGSESRSKEGMLKPDGLTDIPLLLMEIRVRYGEHDPHAIIECKRISGTNTRLCREYVNEGINRFKTGKYASNHSNGFMAGYVIAGDSTAAARGINSQLTKQSRRGENLARADRDPSPWLWRSQHSRQTSSPIRLHHGLFCVRPVDLKCDD